MIERGQGEIDWTDGRVEERGPSTDGQGKQTQEAQGSPVQIIIGRRMSLKRLLKTINKAGGKITSLSVKVGG